MAQKILELDEALTHLHPVVGELLNFIWDRGEQAWLVGGALRDAFLGWESQDYDLASTGSPAWHEEQLQELGWQRQARTAVAQDLGSALFVHPNYPRLRLEITTLREEGGYQDQRHPTQLSFTRDLLKDLKRRDFTVNALAYAPQTGLRDPFGGLKDLAAGRLAAIGECRQRLQEDPLRCWRCLRFQAKLNLDLEPSLAEALPEVMAEANTLSQERLAEERQGILQGEAFSRVWNEAGSCWFWLWPAYVAYLQSLGLQARPLDMPERPFFEDELRASGHELLVLLRALNAAEASCLGENRAREEALARLWREQGHGRGQKKQQQYIYNLLCHLPFESLALPTLTHKQVQDAQADMGLARALFQWRQWQLPKRGHEDTLKPEERRLLCQVLKAWLAWSLARDARDEKSLRFQATLQQLITAEALAAREEAMLRRKDLPLAEADYQKLGLPAGRKRAEATEALLQAWARGDLGIWPSDRHLGEEGLSSASRALPIWTGGKEAWRPALLAHLANNILK